MNVYNDLSLLFLSQLGIKSAALSLELTFAQIRENEWGSSEMECVVHGALPMMVSQYCALGSIVGGKCADSICTRPVKKDHLV